MEHKIPLVVNLYAGPGAGKTTAALEITAALKKAGYNVEYVSEYAKELVLEKRLKELEDQEKVTNEQYHRLDRLRSSGVEIIVTDSPVLLGKIYGKGKISPEYEKKIMDYYESFDNFNLVVKRGETFQQEGRLQNLEQSKALDQEIISLLRDNNLFYGNYHHDEIAKTVTRVNQTMERLYGIKKNTAQKAQKTNSDKLDDISRNVPPEMKALPNWCAFRTRWNEEKGKKDKFILSPHDGHWAKSTDPTTWTDFETAMQFAKEKGCEGLAFALDGKCGISCIDLDKCLDEQGKPKANISKNVLAGTNSYTEVSASGNGLHVFLKDTIVGSTYNNRAEIDGNEIEVYEAARFISMTGDLYENRKKLSACPKETKTMLRDLLKERVKYEPSRTTALTADDNEVVERIKRSKRKEEYEQLSSGQSVSNDKSRDDFRMAGILAFFSGGNTAQIVRIMRSSGINRPDKPDIYYERTAEKAASMCMSFYGDMQTSKNLQKQVFTSNQNNDEGNGR